MKVNSGIFTKTKQNYYCYHQKKTKKIVKRDVEEKNSPKTNMSKNILSNRVQYIHIET